MTMLKNTDFTSETAIRDSYHDINDRNQHSGMIPPFCIPFRIQVSRVQIVNFLHFWSSIPKFVSSQKLLPPLFAPPFGIFGKFRISSTIYVCIIFPQNAFFWLYRPISLYRISPFTMINIIV